MAPLLRAALAGAAMFVASVWVGSTGVTPEQNLRVTRDPILPPASAAHRRMPDADLAAMRIPPPTTAAPQRPARASRSAPRPRPAPIVAQAQQSALPEARGCGMWGYKTRAQSDACWGPIIASYGDWPVGRMLAILYCESKGNPWVVNASNHVGLLQIKGSTTKGDGPANIAHGHAMWLRSGTAPWRQCGG